MKWIGVGVSVRWPCVCLCVCVYDGLVGTSIMGWRHDPYARAGGDLPRDRYRQWIKVVSVALGYHPVSQRRVAMTSLSRHRRHGIYSRDWWATFASDPERAARLMSNEPETVDEAALVEALWKVREMCPAKRDVGMVMMNGRRRRVMPIVR